MRVGFIGLGRMGRGMASNLLRSDVDLVVFDSNPEAADVMVEAGAERASSIGDLARQSDVIFLSLPGPAHIEEVVYGPDGLLENVRSGHVLFDLSTSGLSLARRIHLDFARAGASMLDAPVSGGPAGAASGELVIWVGGDRPTFDRYIDLLKSIGENPRHVGAIGAGTVTKLSHNLLGYMIMLGMAEVFSVAVKADVDPLDLWESMRLGVVGKRSPLHMLTKQFLPGEYDQPAMALMLAHKDVTLATTMGRELGVPMRMASLTLDEMSEAIGEGFGEHDSRAYLQLQLKRAGVDIAVDPERLRKALEADGEK